MKMSATTAIGEDARLGYVVVMFVIITFGLLGNIAMTVVLRQVEHRAKTVSHLILNLALADIIICALGYPVAIQFNLTDDSTLMKDSSRCRWLAFINTTTGIACILTLTVMSAMQYQGVRSRTPTVSDARKRLVSVVILGIWVFAMGFSIPPIFGWNRFVTALSQVSCHPDWASQDPSDKAYIWFLVTGGFLFPLTVICFSYALTYRHLRSSTTSCSHAQMRRLKIQKKLSRLITASSLAFLLNWTPYCLVSLSSTLTGHHVVSPTLSLVPELMAKSSVVSNPFVYFVMNASFRRTLRRTIARSNESPMATNPTPRTEATPRTFPFHFQR